MSELISREALQKIFVAECEGECRYCKHMKGDFNGCALFDAVPAVDAEPVRHGYWIQNKSVPDYHSCSDCHVTQKMRKVCGAYLLPKYCPNCGAKMEDENNG